MYIALPLKKMTLSATLLLGLWSPCYGAETKTQSYTLWHEPQTIQDQLRVFYTTTPGAALHPLAINPRSPIKVLRTLTIAFLRLAKTLKGHKPFKPVQMPQPNHKSV